MSAPDSKEPITNDDISTKTPKESLVTLGTAILQVLPTNVPTPPILPSPIAAPPQSPLPPLLGVHASPLGIDGDMLAGVKNQKSRNANRFSENNRKSFLGEIHKGYKLRTKKEQATFDAKMEARRQQGENCKKEKETQSTSTPGPSNMASILARRVAVEFSDSESEHSESESSWNDDENTHQKTSYIQSSSKKESIPKSSHRSGDGAGTRESTPLQESNITSLEIKSSDNNGDVSALPPPLPPLPNQGVSAPPPPPFPTEGLNNRKPSKDNYTSGKSLDGTSPKNSSPTELKNHNKDFQEELQEKLQMMKERTKSKQIQDLTKKSNVELKDNKGNIKSKTQEKYVERIEKQQEEGKKQNKRDVDSAEMCNKIRETISPSNNESEHFKSESGCSDDENTHQKTSHIQSSTKKEEKNLERVAIDLVMVRGHENLRHYRSQTSLLLKQNLVVMMIKIHF